MTFVFFFANINNETKTNAYKLGRSPMKQAKSQNKTEGPNTTLKKAKAPSTRRRDSALSKEKLINAGVQVISKLGYNAATTKNIAAKAGVNEALIGRYFGGKEGLLITIFQSFVEESLCADLGYEPQATLKDELVEYFKDKLLIPRVKEDLAKIIISQSLIDTKFRRRLMKETPIAKDDKLYKRLQAFKTLTPRQIETIMDDVETYLRGIFVMQVLILETPREVAMKQCLKFLNHYTQGFGPK